MKLICRSNRYDNTNNELYIYLKYRTKTGKIKRFLETYGRVRGCLVFIGKTPI
jgi:hypothetical protein